MVRPLILEHKPAFVLAFPAGVVASVLLLACLYLGPAAGVPLVDLPALIGGVFTDDPAGALGVGLALFLIVGVFVYPMLLAVVWWQVPGSMLSLPGAFLKGAIFGLGAWLLMGLLMPLLGLLNQLPAFSNPGFFGLSEGPIAAVLLLAAHLAYGLALGGILGMSSGIKPLDTLGFEGHYHGAAREAAFNQGRGRAFGELGTVATNGGSRAK